MELARAVLAELDDCTDPAVREPADLLGRVVADDTETDPEDSAGRRRIRAGVARDRVVSHTDPQMRHGRKSASRRFDGHKLHVLTDEDSELVLGVDIDAGNGGDGAAAAPLLEQVQAGLTTAGLLTGADRSTEPDCAGEGVRVETLLADMAYSDGDTRVAVEAAGAELVAKVPPVSNAGRFPKTEFTISFDATDRARAVTCPAGHTSTDAHRVRDHKGRPALRFDFAAGLCAQCPLRPRCIAGSGGRSVTVGTHEARIARARARQH